ncbi:hypothetical protein ACIGXM_31865 [Kitasatospora sp. NPDC052896]|uniref:DUF7878 domain-containing protein n=1 Tax=Kitasatospora sp. NPDC052896 TaxID=3364061 RepID=UPI0037C9E551
MGELLVNIEADLTISDSEQVVYSEPLFPVAELAMELAAWICGPGGELSDFAFESMSFEEVGSVRIVAGQEGWRVGSVFEPDTWTGPIDRAALVTEIGRFFANVRASVAAAGIDPRFMDVPRG